MVFGGVVASRSLPAQRVGGSNFNPRLMQVSSIRNSTADSGANSANQRSVFGSGEQYTTNQRRAFSYQYMAQANQRTVFGSHEQYTTNQRPAFRSCSDNDTLHIYYIHDTDTWHIIIYD